MFIQCLPNLDSETHKITYKISKTQVIYLFYEKASSTLEGEFLNSIQEWIIGEKLVVKASVSIVLILLLR